MINCARGGVVDNLALFKALESGHIRAAGVDVMPIEPPLIDDPLILHPQVVMTPHNAASAMSAAIAMSEMSAQNVVNMFAGKLERGCIFNFDNLNFFLFIAIKLNIVFCVDEFKKRFGIDICAVVPF